MAIGIDPRDEREYILKADRKLPQEQQTVWLLSDLEQRVRTTIDNSLDVQINEDGTQRIKGTGSMFALALRHGLKGTKAGFPLRDAAGNPIPFKRHGRSGPVADEFISRISRADQAELALAILREEDEEPEHADDKPATPRADALEKSAP